MARQSKLASDLTALARQERQRLGDPPAAEQLRALIEGQLTDEEAEAIREQLSVEPELAAAYLDLKHTIEGSPKALSEAAEEADAGEAWRRLSDRVQHEAQAAEESPNETGRIAPFLSSRSGRTVLALAAMLVVALGVGLWLRDGDGRGPAVTGEYFAVRITGETFRGGEVMLPQDAAGLNFHISTTGLPERIVIELLNSSDELVERADIVIESEQGTVEFLVAAGKLASRTYEIVVRGDTDPPESPPRLTQTLIIKVDDQARQ